ncbi:MAG: hypothetical protein IAC58_05000 [Firmicutes bacterium]|uniref:Uncharacterized protein n=1 Tax=Candidatus Onthovivens merdipullorum TaxID=2840889 RepID=A0A9D9GXS6_9BACL|nr:hypothetical protein [Candidatus Onthovivens merdipullorum]
MKKIFFSLVIVPLLPLLMSMSGPDISFDKGDGGGGGQVILPYEEIIDSNSEPLKLIDFPDAYVYVNYNVKKFRYTENSDLYLLNVSAEFTPGVVAKANGEHTSAGEDYKKYYLNTGYLHVAVSQFEDDGNKGGSITPKAYWPSSNSVTTTFTSTYGISLAFSSSLESGIELSPESLLTISVGSKNETSLTLHYEESTSSTTDDPKLSSQTSSNNPMERQRSYSVQGYKTAGAITYPINSYYLFEMSKTDYYRRDVFNIEIEVQTINMHYILGFKDEGWEVKGTYSDTLCNGDY